MPERIKKPPFAPAKQINTTNRWGDSQRTYQTPEGDVYPGVTSILSVIAKPKLLNWAVNTERTMVIEASANLWEDLPVQRVKMSRPAYIATLTDRIGKTKANQKELAKAAEIGSQTHALIEWNLRRELGQQVGPEPRVTDKALWAFMVYEEWRKRTRLTPRAIEQVVWSRAHRYAGTMDLFGLVDLGEGPVHAVFDWKTAKALYREALLQNAAYVHAMIEMGHVEPPCYGLIVRLPKVETDPDPEVRVITPEEHAGLFQVFCAVRELWEWVQEMEQRS